jgi:hypothetical protein
MSKKSVILSSESLNSYGTWLPVAGAILDKFKANPVMFYSHKTYSMLPIGIWENIRIEGGKILADPVFDQDEESKKIQAKFESGSIRGASIAADIIEMSSDPKWLKPGQTRETITKYEIYEASLTPLPANADCLTLSLRKNGIELSGNSLNTTVHLLKPDTEMKDLALKLGLSQDATKEQMAEKIDQLLATATRAGKLEAHFTKLADKLDEKQKGIFSALAKTDIDKALEYVELSSGETKKDPEKPQKVIDLIVAGKKDPEEVKNSEDDKESFDYLQKHDSKKLADIRRSDPVKYQKMVDEYAASKRKGQ